MNEGLNRRFAWNDWVWQGIAGRMMSLEIKANFLPRFFLPVGLDGQRPGMVITANDEKIPVRTVFSRIVYKSWDIE